MDTFRNRKRKKRKKEIRKKKEETGNRLIKDRITRDIRTLLELEIEKDYSKPKRANNFLNNHYIKHEGNGE